MSRPPLSRVFGTAAVVVLSVGWLLPAYAGLHAFISYLEEVLDLRLKGLQPMTDFDFLLEMRRMLTTAILWLAAAISFWAGLAACRVLATKNKP